MIAIKEQRPRQEAAERRGGQRQAFSRRAEIGPILDTISERMAGHHYSEKDTFAVRLAVEEGLVNALKHGNHEDPGKQVEISFLVGPERVLIEIQDEGEGFDPEDVPDPLAPENLERSTGRGVYLMRTYMTWVRFNGGGNCVTMCKCRQGTSPGDF